MYDVITIGSISVDMYFKGETLTRVGDRYTLAVGGKYFVDYFYAGLGGGAANVAIGIQKHGFKTAIFGKIGNNQFKPLILKLLKDHDIQLHHCEEEDGYIKISSILLSPEGERTIIHYESPHGHYVETDEDLKKLEHAKIIYLSNLSRVPLEERRRILSHAASKNIITIMNLGIADCRRPNEQIASLLQHTSILIVNTHEFAELVKKPFESIDFKKDTVHLLPILRKKITVITDGKNGSYAYVNGEVYHESAPHVDKVVDTTGAGDAFSVGFIAGYLKKASIETALQLGNKYGAHIVQKIGAN
ncbi:MAG: carbohydrate kinase family protein [bacterium]